MPINFTGIDELKNENAIHFYPNPFTSTTYFRSEVLLENASMTVYNSLGQAVKRMDNLTGKTTIIHRDNLPSGLYFICITLDGRTIKAGKLIITDN